jgi:hypothetical protein
VGKFGGYGAHRLIRVYYGKAPPEENPGDTCCPSSVNTGVHGDAWAIRIAGGVSFTPLESREPRPKLHAHETDERLCESNGDNRFLPANLGLPGQTASEYAFGIFHLARHGDRNVFLGSEERDLGCLTDRRRLFGRRLNGAHFADELPVGVSPKSQADFRSDFDFTDVGFWNGDLNSDRARVLDLGERCSLLEMAAAQNRDLSW